MRTECTAGQTPPWALNLTGVALEAAVRKRISDALGHFNGTVSIAGVTGDLIDILGAGERVGRDERDDARHLVPRQHRGHGLQVMLAASVSI